MKIGELKALKQLIKEELIGIKVSMIVQIGIKNILFFDEENFTVRNVVESKNQNGESCTTVNSISTISLDDLIFGDNTGLPEIMFLYILKFLEVYYITLYNFNICDFIGRRDATLVFLGGVDRNFGVIYSSSMTANGFIRKEMNLLNFFLTYKPVNYHEIDRIPIFER